MSREKRSLFIFTILSTFIWGLFAHGYCYFNLAYSHDSLLVYQNDFECQISNGRFLHMVYFLLRGNFYTPSLVGFLSLIFIGIAACFIISLFKLKDKLSACILSGILTVNVTVTLLNATYIHEIDIFSLSMLLAVMSVYVCRRFRFGVPVGAVLIFCSLGLYQGFFQVAAFLFMMIAVLDILRNAEFKQVWKDGVRAVIMLAGGMILYYIVLKIILLATVTELSSMYNSISSVGKFDGLFSFIRSIAFTYARVVWYFINPITSHKILAVIVNILVIGSAAFFLIALIKNRKIRGKNLALLLVLIALMPFGINVVCFLSKGMEHHLMMYSFVLVYVFACLLFKEFLTLEQVEFKLSGQKSSVRRIMRNAVPILLIIIVFNNIIYANQAYLKKDLEYQSALLTMNRIVERMEQVDGYAAGETPVVFLGTFDDSPAVTERFGFDYIGTGLAHKSPLTYTEVYKRYFEYVLAYPVNVIDSGYENEWWAKPEVQSMPVFPAKDSCRMVGKVLMIKLSNPE